MADESLRNIVDFLVRLADKAVDNSAVSGTSTEEAKRILARFRIAVPAVGCSNFADILNAGWMAFTDDQLWSDSPALHKNRYGILNELVLKTVEILEIEHRKREYEEDAS